MQWGLLFGPNGALAYVAANPLAVLITADCDVEEEQLLLWFKALFKGLTPQEQQRLALGMRYWFVKLMHGQRDGGADHAGGGEPPAAGQSEGREPRRRRRRC